MRALVADDDPEFLDLIAQAIEQLGARVVRACSGPELQNELTAGPPFDVVVTDVSMPRPTGLEVMLAARAAGLPWPIVIMTALRDDRTTAQVAALGEHVVLLYKPFAITELRVALRACLGDSMPMPRDCPRDCH
jgi:two-component system response regulator QseB